jgi:hypothetical protein
MKWLHLSREFILGSQVGQNQALDADPFLRSFPDMRNFSDRLRAIAHLAAEQDSSLDSQTGTARHGSVAAPGLTKRQVFFRFSTRQSMLLIIILSIFLAVNRDNRIDDFLFVISFVFNRYCFMLIIIAALVSTIAKAARQGRNPCPSGRSIHGGRDPGDSWSRRAAALAGRLRLISRLVSEQRRSRGAPAGGDSASRLRASRNS